MTDKQIIIEGGVCLNCGAKTKKHILICDKCTEEMGTVIAHKFTIDKQTKEIKQLNKQLKRKEQECERWEEILDDFFKIQYKLVDNNKKLRQCLTEIKEICNNNDELKGNFNLVDCDKYKLGKHNLAQKILAKINEVDNEKI